jgi:3-isopropylmalate/(R)-2-methylmalate dehydratase small subunit
MQTFVTLSGVAAPLPIANVDTDQIIPKQFLSTVERKGLARGLFYDMRVAPDGSANPDFVLNKPAYAGASVLITGPNFGCGSSREHAPWALLDHGIRCVIASSFADIFYNNCFKNGVLPLVLPESDVQALMAEADGHNARFEIDLEAQTVTAPSGARLTFAIDPGRKRTLLLGLDEIGETLLQASAIAAHEDRRQLATPWLDRGRSQDEAHGDARG